VQVVSALAQCPSEVKGSVNERGEECTPQWSCKVEPAVCPPHGTQNTICKDVSGCVKGEGSIRNQQIQCSPGLCSGCYVPRWFGDENNDNKCIPYGFRFEQASGSTIELVERSESESLSAPADSNDYSLDIISSEKATLTLHGDTKDYTYNLVPGGTADLTDYSKDGNKEDVVSLVIKVKNIAYSNNPGAKNYVDLTIEYKAFEKQIKKFNAYCDIDGDVKTQRTKEFGVELATCQNNYECESNLCSSGQCVEINELIKEAKGFKGFLIKAICRLTNPFSSSGYEQCVAGAYGSSYLPPSEAEASPEPASSG